MRSLALLLCLATGSACAGEESAPTTTTTTTGGGGEGAGGGVPAPPAWGPAWACPPGELRLEDGSCQPAGIPAEACGDHFESDGDGSCVAILPPAPCPEGRLAIPGETSCRDVAPCSGSKWGAATLDVDTEFVDQAYGGADSDGTEARPWLTVQEAVDAATDGAVVAIAAGTYAESILVMNKGVRLWGRCPAEVRLVGTGAVTLDIDEGGDGTEVHDLAITGSTRGVRITDAADVVLERVHLHDVGIGVAMLSFDLPSSAALRGSLVERAGQGAWVIGSTLAVEDSAIVDGAEPTGHGLSVDGSASIDRLGVLELDRVLLTRLDDDAIIAYGADVTLRDVVVRDVPATNVAAFGAISMQQLGGLSRRPQLVAERVIIEDAGATALSLIGADATVSALAVRDISPPADVVGDGIFVSSSAVDALPTAPDVTLRTSTVDRVSFAGISLVGAHATLEGVRVRDVAADAASGANGRGIEVAASSETLLQSNATLRGCVVERSVEGGIVVLGSHADIESARVSDVDVRPSDAGFGRGIAFELSLGFPVSGSVTDSLVERVHEVGIGVTGGAISVADCAVEAVAASADVYGVCIAAQMGLPELVSSTLTLSDSSVEDCEGFGVLVVGSEAELRHVSVTGVGPNLATDAFGDGVTVVTAAGIDPSLDATAHLDGVLIGDNARAGIASFGGAVTMSDVYLTCNAIQLNGETLSESRADFADGGGNDCLCDEDVAICKVLSETLEAPQL